MKPPPESPVPLKNRSTPSLENHVGQETLSGAGRQVEGAGMGEMRPLLAGCESHGVARRPCPMVEQSNVLDRGVYEELARTHASCLHSALVKLFVPGQGLDYYPGHARKQAPLEVPDNTKIARDAADMLADPTLPPVWREFIQANCSQAALDSVLKIFGESILQEHPDFEDRFGPLSTLRAKCRGIGVPGPGDVEMDVQVGLQSAVKGGPCLQRGPHVKRPDKIFEAYLYLREEGDAHEDGPHEFFVPVGHLPPTFGAGWQTDPAGVRQAHSMPTRGNSCIAWINTPHSIQQVGLRGPTPHPLMYVELLVQMPEQIFQVSRIPGWAFDSTKMPSPLSEEALVVCAMGEADGKSSACTYLAGWHLQEQDEKGPFRWTGPAADSFLQVPWTGTGDALLRVSVRHAITPETVDTVTVRVNEESILLRKRACADGLHLEGVVPETVLGKTPGSALVHFHIEHSQRSCDVHEGQTDTRRLGLGIGAVSLLPPSTRAGEEAKPKKSKAPGVGSSASQKKKFKHRLKHALQKFLRRKD